MLIKLKVKIYQKFQSQADYALALRVDESTVSRVIRGRRVLPAKEQQRWASVLGCEPKEIFKTDRKSRIEAHG
jgi:hypothetical protein